MLRIQLKNETIESIKLSRYNVLIYFFNWNIREKLFTVYENDKTEEEEKLKYSIFGLTALCKFNKARKFFTIQSVWSVNYWERNSIQRFEPL